VYNTTDGDCCPVELMVLAVRKSRCALDNLVVVDDLPEDQRRARLAHHSTDDRYVLVADHCRRRQTDDARSIWT